ncbi:competence protein ComE [Helicobacter didelphidarum]|uniref:Competence protein ComE n=1 Tax=Helicobacter didelphidarum TaxID=2040648 RepID=A0A3D8IPC1_9HELI|nr:ComEC/Rec2 family competence protein [Helicobacter didelphidarum]RDU66963.1 competence protein ComE [Helicobacter didelphidarum]
MNNFLSKNILKKMFYFFKNIYYINIRQQKNNYFSIQIPFIHYCISLLILGLTLCGNLYYKYTIFIDLKQGRSFEATIINHYPKSKVSERFKFQDSNSNVFYGTYRGKFKNIIGKKAQVYGKIYHCSFLQFLKSCNIYNSTFSLLPIDNVKRTATNFIMQQHEYFYAANLYNALFFSQQLAKPVRDTSVALGLAHLIAISGFHLAALMIIFYALISPIYFFFHRFFCYRNAIFDLGFLGLLFAFFYLALIDFEPSFLRAFIMACVAYFIVFSGLKIFSFMNLFLCVFLACANNPSLIFHIGFLLSVSGVFYIFLFVQHIEPYLRLQGIIKRICIGILLFNCIIFLQMMPIVHYVFPYFSPYQLISIPLSIAFFLLFPCLIFLHIIGQGSLFDSLILLVVEHKFLLSEVYTPLWLLLIYIFLTLLSIRYKTIYYMTIILSLLFYFWNLKIFFYYLFE